MISNIRQKIANFIAPAQKNTVTLPNEFLRYGNGRSITPDWKQVIMTDEDMYTGYGYATIRKRANAVASMATEYVKTEAKIDEYTHPYLEIIESSPTFTDYDFWYEISTYLDLEGIYYLMAVRNYQNVRFGDVQKFTLLNPYNIHRVINYGDMGEEVGGYIETRGGMQREIPKEMIIEIKEFNPFKNTDPYSMSDAAKEAQFGLKTSGDYTRHAMRNNINSPGIITSDVIMSDNDFANFKARVTEHTHGKPLVGNGAGAIKWEPMNIDLKNAAVKDTKEIDREELFAITGVSKTIMGIEQSGVTRETSKVQRDLLSENEIIPRIRLIIDSLNQDYRNYYQADFARTEANIYIDNPLKTDHDADQSALDVLKGRSELYDSLLLKGYRQDLVSQYVNGEIDVDQLGEPDRPQLEEGSNTGGESNDSGGQNNETQIEKVENQNEGENGENVNQVSQQESALKNAIINVDTKIVASMLQKVESKTSRNQFEEDFTQETDIISGREKKSYVNELELVLLGFYGLIMNIKGGEAMRKRMESFALPGLFKFNRDIRSYVKKLSKQTAESHIDTIANDIFKTARDEALKGKGQREIVNAIKQKYADTVTETRAKTIARTEANRAFTRAQYEADVQFLKQNKLTKRAYKQWRTRSGNPCQFCLEMERRGPIPFGSVFVGESLEVDGKTLDTSYEEVKAGNLHPNCSCIYELVLRDENNREEFEELAKALNTLHD